MISLRRGFSHIGGDEKGSGLCMGDFLVGWVEDFGKISGWPSVVNTHGSSPLCNG